MPMRVLSGFGLMVAVGVVALAPGVAKAQTLDAVLKQMDASSAKFRSAEANLRRDIFELVVKETTTQTGITYFQRSGSNLQMGIKFDPPSSQIVEIKDGLVQMFEPNANHLTTFSIKKDRARFESFLAVGFGGSGTDLAKLWTITFLGMEPMNDGPRKVQTAKLDLVAKDESTRNTVKHITIWVDPVQNVSLKQQIFFPDGNIQTATYTNLRVNQLTKSALDAFAIKYDKKTVTVDNH
jgi:outer membrane lipoprotein-sorting protein